MAALFFIFINSLCGLAVPSSAAAFEKKPLAIITATGRHELTVEVASTSHELQQGLMFRRSLGAGEGMLFIYAKPHEVKMWMKNTYISLDMVFVRENGTVLRVERDTEPFSLRTIESGGPAIAVIELLAGSADRLGIKSGDKVDYSTFK
ncbi:MAG: DUF192 domain-containing protein [Alphaproteobacteria bacterium]